MAASSRSSPASERELALSLPRRPPSAARISGSYTTRRSHPTSWVDRRTNVPTGSRPSEHSPGAALAVAVHRTATPPHTTEAFASSSSPPPFYGWFGCSSCFFFGARAEFVTCFLGVVAASRSSPPRFAAAAPSGFSGGSRAGRRVPAPAEHRLLAGASQRGPRVDCSRLSCAVSFRVVIAFSRTRARAPNGYGVPAGRSASWLPAGLAPTATTVGGFPRASRLIFRPAAGLTDPNVGPRCTR